MKKHVRSTLLTLLALTLMLTLTACGSSGDILTGTWEGTSENSTSCTWTFDGEGACTLKNVIEGSPEDFVINLEGTYTIDEAASTVTIKIAEWDEEKVYDYTLSDTSLSFTATDIWRDRKSVV